MNETIEAIYENGVFKPIKDIDLPEHNKFKIIIIKEKEYADKRLNKSDKKLLDLLDHPVSMGKISYKNRGDIYNDID